MARRNGKNNLNTRSKKRRSDRYGHKVVWARIARQIEDTARTLEAHFGDMCDFEFTVEEGRLFVLMVRRGKRSPKAAIRIATDLFLEGVITGKAMLERISPIEIAELLRAQTRIDEKAPTLGVGIPASAGAAAGVVAFTSESVLRLAQAGNSVIFVCLSDVREDIVGFAESSGIVTFDGGMTSHAAVISRGMRKPCVVGLGWSFHPSASVAVTPVGDLKEGDPITIDGNSGKVFAGFRDFYVPRASEDERVMLILSVIDVLASAEELPYGRIGTIWRVRDLLVHGGNDIDPQDTTNQLQAWPTNRHAPPPHAYQPLDRTQCAALSRELLSFSVNRDDKEFLYLWLGLRRWLQRCLAKFVGTGKHPSFYRPLFDPCETILDLPASRAWQVGAACRVQLVGEEYFSINHYVPDYVEMESVRIYWATACRGPHELWRIDSTNPHGEKLLEGAADILALKVVLNDGVVSLDVLPRLYNYLRGREYFLSWYEVHGTCRHELQDLLNSRAEKKGTIRDGEILRSAGLVTVDGEITKAGLSLVRPTSAEERATQDFKMGW